MPDPKKGSRSNAPHPQPESERWESSSDLGSTMKLGSPAGRPQQRGLPVPPRIPDPPRTRQGSQRGIELIVVDEKQAHSGERRPWRAAEVWTKRRVYGLDSTFKCVEILDRASGKPEPSNELIGARLGGGRLRDKDTVRFSYPLPVPGMEAMFSKSKKHGYTSPVERMIVRVRVLHIAADEVMPSWDEIASRWSEAPPKP
jgi:hypothetical protein